MSREGLLTVLWISLFGFGTTQVSAEIGLLSTEGQGNRILPSLETTEQLTQGSGGYSRAWLQ